MPAEWLFSPLLKKTANSSSNTLRTKVELKLVLKEREINNILESGCKVDICIYKEKTILENNFS